MSNYYSNPILSS